MSLSGSPVSLAPAPRPAGGGRPVRSPFERRVDIYELACADDQTPNAYNLTPSDIAGYRCDRLTGVDAVRVVRALDVAGVSL